MITYALECIAFQFIFLMGYEFFLRKETFFQGNRFYLLTTFACSFIIPFLKIEAFRTVLPARDFWGAAYVQRLDEVTVTAAARAGLFADIPWAVLMLVSGITVAMILFVFKLHRINRLKRNGLIQHFSDYTKVVVSNSTMAFSFFRNIFIGDRIRQDLHGQIIAHEKVHIQQRHSLDLLFFELMRIFNWFNPLVYVYQNRISELHEFIADSRIPGEARKQQYELLLCSVFETHDISFINQFFQSSLIKKRIVMLKKSPSPGIWKFKYLLLVPAIALMLCYNSCREESFEYSDNTMQVKDVENLSAQEERELFAQLVSLSENNRQWNFTVSDGNTSVHFSAAEGDSYITGPDNERIRAQMVIEGEMSGDFMNPFSAKDDPVPFGLVESVPVFPGCGDADDLRECFNQQMFNHIKKNFRYPHEAIAQQVEGTVSVMFTIDQNGNIVDIKKRGPHALLENEADRIIRRLPQMKPGRLKGSDVKVYYSIPITFRLQ